MLEIYDASTTEALIRCPRYGYWRYHRGLVLDRASAAQSAPDFGTAIHAGLNSWYELGEPKVALRVFLETYGEGFPGDELRTPARGVEILSRYFERYPREPFRVISLERPFGFVLESENPDGSCPKCHAPWSGPDSCTREEDTLRPASRCAECGHTYPLVAWFGRIDMLIEWNGAKYVLDHKTSSRLGPSYFRQWRPSLQMRGYAWAAEKIIGEPVDGVLINAIGVYKRDFKFEREIIPIEPWETELFQKRALWEIQLNESRIRASRLASSNPHEVWPENWTACGDYGGCPFRELCLTTEPERLIPLMYREERWDPRDLGQGVRSSGQEAW